ncbi:MAG: hypothetical protein LBM69_06270, partial [Lachnospiraceae bacterium]|nr:hypothetical protein [Lachnospiraceae bacterium]
YAATKLTEKNGTLLLSSSAPAIHVILSDTTRYLHLAAVDFAGNISFTIHIRVSKQDDEVAWELCTDQLMIDCGDNVYPAGALYTYYVKSDGLTPFTIHQKGRILTDATGRYQINYSTFRAQQLNGTLAQRFTLQTPSHLADQGDTLITLGASIREEGSSILQSDGYNITTRSNENRDLTATQRFVMSSAYSEETIQVTPIVGADYKNTVVTSLWESDLLHSIYLIGDSKPPTISGGEQLDDLTLLDRGEGEVTLLYTAQDNGSGVKEFYVEITNDDNKITNRYEAGVDGSIRITITEDEPIFSGDFTVTVSATDNVGNHQSKAQGATEFALTTNITRILSPHDPIFKRGESGILEITAYGYIDIVEVVFPTEMTDQNPDLNTSFIYTNAPSYVQNENLEFMVPLYMPDDGEFIISVKAYKDGKEINLFPSLNVIKVEGSVLDEIRTRLR